jgi:hypothetical protein
VGGLLRVDFVRLCFFSFIIVALTACAVVDQYSGRAVVYNLQAEQAQEQALLLNVVRASLRRPMQFTGLQSITGTANASGSLTGGGASTNQRPLVSLFGLTPPSTSTVVSDIVGATVGGTASISGGPTFSVPVLDTQEFYQGFLTPISGQLLDLYYQYGYPRDVLFNVVIEKIILKRSDGECPAEMHVPECEITIRNYAPEDVSLELFQGVLGYLIRLGLSTEPIMEPETNRRMPTVNRTSSDGKASSASLADTAPKPFGFCFAPREAASYQDINRRVLCGHPAAGLELKASEIGRRAQITGVPFPKTFVDALYSESIEPRLSGENFDVRAEGFRKFRSFGGKKLSISFYTRSIEWILYYLGEVVRRSAHPEGGQSARRVQVRVGPPQNPFPLKSCPFEDNIDGYRCTDLFVLEQGASDPAGISVEYAGVRYSISSDTSHSWTMPVFDVVKQLQAINTSAKQLPASNLISVLSN